MLSENELRHKHQNQPRHPPFCSNAQTRRIWNERFNWPDVANFLVLMLCFVFTRRKANASVKHKQLILSENERRHKHQNQPRHPPFCSNAQTRRIWNERFNWPDVANFLVLMPCFVFTRRKVNASIKHKQLMLILSENERRHKHQNQPRQPPFCSNNQTQGIWNECFNWPDLANFLVLMLRFVFTRRKRTQA